MRLEWGQEQWWPQGQPLGSAEARPWHASLPGSLCESSESGLLSSVPGVTGSSPSTETKWCLPAAAASLRQRPGWRGHNLPRQAYTQTDLPRTIRAAQTLNCRELQNLEVPLGPKDRDGSHGCKCAQMKFFTHRIIELLNH